MAHAEAYKDPGTPEEQSRRTFMANAVIALGGQDDAALLEQAVLLGHEAFDLLVQLLVVHERTVPVPAANTHGRQARASAAW